MLRVILSRPGDVIVYGRCALNEEVCPVSDQLLGELYRANELGLPALLAAVPPGVRASLALFCYGRSHLHAMGVAIAASCSEDDLVSVGGRIGVVLFAASRQGPPVLPVLSHAANRRKITLAAGPSGQ
jgi:hypothetical protein